METRESMNPYYRAQTGPITADKRDLVIPSFGLKRRQIDLSSALNQERFQLKGDYIWSDSASTGVAEIRLNNTSEDPFPIRAENGFEGMPYTDIFITAPAQPGLILNLWYGYGARFLSTASNISTLTSILNAVKIDDSNGNNIDSRAAFGSISGLRFLETEDGGMDYGVAYASTSQLAANTPDNIVAAGSNTAGMIVTNLQGWGTSASTSTQSFLCKATAPATVVDGDVLALAQHFSAPVSPFGYFPRARVSSGKRLDRINTAISVNGVWAAQVKLL